MANRVEAFGFSPLMAVFALLEDALAFCVLGNLPCVRAADLKMSPPTSIAAAATMAVRAAVLHHRALAWAASVESAVLAQHVLLW